MGKDVSKATKPVMRGLLHASIKRNLIVAIVFAGLSAVATKHFLGDARKKQYAAFYKTYDPEAHFERMREAGLMQSASP